MEKNLIQSGSYLCKRTIFPCENSTVLLCEGYIMSVIGTIVLYKKVL